MLHRLQGRSLHDPQPSPPPQEFFSPPPDFDPPPQSSPPRYSSLRPTVDDEEAEEAEFTGCKWVLLSYIPLTPQWVSRSNTQGNALRTAPSWMDDEYDVWYRDPRLMAHNMLANPTYKKEIDYTPFQQRAQPAASPLLDSIQTTRQDMTPIVQRRD
ncbi:hypothetical protein F4604DRAFT_1684671 [Suillus subluteus]|nr:hypothetical protein F4604DRAFT_1684671 [Suillus subluteus]